MWVCINRHKVAQLFTESENITFSQRKLSTPKAYLTAEPPNFRDKYFVHCSEVVPTSEVEMYGLYKGRGQTVCPL